MNQRSGDEAVFIRSIVADPADESCRLVYADWLDERGDPRAGYLRKEVEEFHILRDDSDNSVLWTEASMLWSMKAALDPVWVARVSRAPFGILVPGLTFSDTGPPIGLSGIKKIEKHWGERLLPDYAAFLLNYNGGCPSKPYLWSHTDVDDYFDKVGFFATVDKHASGKPYMMMSAVEVFDNHVGEDQNEERLNRMMPIGTVTTDDGAVNLIVMLMDPAEEYSRILILESWADAGVVEADDVHSADTFVDLLMALCERSD